MRKVLIAMITVASLLGAVVPALACPNGYAACGTHFCCPK